MTLSESARRTRTLRRHGRRALKLGLPLVLLAAGIGYVAFWWGLDYTGDLILLTAILFGLLGLAVVAIGALAVGVLIEGWVKTHRPGRSRARKGSPESSTRHAQAAPPPNAAAPQQAPPPPPPPGGPRIF